MKAILERHRRETGREPELIVSAPGRVNLIGEHTDYNQGFVLPAAIDRRVLVAASRRHDDLLVCLSLDFDERRQFALSDLRPAAEDGWANYLKGVAGVLRATGQAIAGATLTLTGDVPVGSGLSSSAAVEVAAAFALQQLYGLDLDGLELARVAQRAEREFAGVNCGIMDQFASRMGQGGHALLLDCRSLEFRTVPLHLGTAKLLITNTNVPRKLSSSEYNQRREECQRGLERLQKRRLGTALRDYSPDEVLSAGLPLILRRRCLHVTAENVRVLEAEAALRRRDLAAFGLLMNRSHESLRDLYQVSCPQLDWLVERAWGTPGVYGSRMTGAGFGGCTVTLLEEEAVEEYRRRIEGYRKAFSLDPDLILCVPSDGARVVHRTP